MGTMPDLRSDAEEGSVHEGNGLGPGASRDLIPSTAELFHS